MKKKAFDTGLIVSIVVIILVCIVIFPVIKGSFLEDIEEKQLKKRAIDYFCEKHNAEKGNVKVKDNYLYGEHENCMFGCYESYINLEYDDIEYTVTYDLDKDTFMDNTQEAELEYTLSKAIKDKFDFILVEIDSQHVEYQADDISYKNVENIEEYTKNKRGFSGDISVSLYIDTATESIAKDYYEKYTKEIIQYMERFGVSYSLTIGCIDDNFPGVYYMSPKYYQIYVNENTFRLFDNVNNKKIDGKKADYINGQFMK